MTQSHSSPTRPATLVEGLEQLSAGVALVAGQRLGPYRLVKALGEGGMARRDLPGVDEGLAVEA